MTKFDYAIIDDVTGEELLIGTLDNIADAQATALNYPNATCYALPGGSLSAPRNEDGTRNLTRLKQMLCKATDDLVGTLRLRYITEISGQQLTYWIKYNQALAYQNNPSIPTSQIGYLVVSAAKCGETLSQRAETIVAMGSGWDPINEQLEGTRDAVKKNIGLATTIQACYAATQVDWEQVILDGQA